MATARLARYDNRALDDRELEFRLNSERLAGSFDALPMASQASATIELMPSEAIKTRATAGEDLDRESVGSSLLTLMTSDSWGREAPPRALDIVVTVFCNPTGKRGAESDVRCRGILRSLSRLY